MLSYILESGFFSCSTTLEAIQCGQKMQAKFTLLNHFSQRYPKIPVFNKEFNDCVGIAFDHMQVSNFCISIIWCSKYTAAKVYIWELHCGVTQPLMYCWLNNFFSSLFENIQLNFNTHLLTSEKQIIQVGTAISVRWFFRNLVLGEFPEPLWSTKTSSTTTGNI